MASPQPDETASISSREAIYNSQPSLERLVAYFVASKASLSSVSHVWRANEIVAAARTALERLAALHAKNYFLRRSIDSQLQVANTIRRGVGVRADNAHADFKDVLRKLDKVDVGVKLILETLKNTYAEPSFHSEQEKQKCLYDFVEEQGLDELRGFFRNCIDETNDAQSVLAGAIDNLDAELEAITLAGERNPGGPKSHDFVSTAATFHALESHATEMADLLQSLVRHYDLCASALKHTEGGNEAAEQAPGDLPPGVDIESLQPDAPPMPMSDAERTEMLKVLENDAAEVDEVVQELREHASEMEFQLEQITNQSQMVESEHTATVMTTSLLMVLAEHLPTYLEESSVFMSRWEMQKERIEGRMEELENLRLFYEGFLNAYDGLIVEIARRKRVKSSVDKIISSAMAEIRKIYEADVDERESFQQEQGEYLPSDLWPGLVAQPMRYEIKPVQDGGEMLPNISKDTLHRALHRTGRSTGK